MNHGVKDSISPSTDQLELHAAHLSIKREDSMSNNSLDWHIPKGPIKKSWNIEHVPTQPKIQETRSSPASHVILCVALPDCNHLVRQDESFPLPHPPSLGRRGNIEGREKEHVFEGKKKKKSLFLFISCAEQSNYGKKTFLGREL